MPGEYNDDDDDDNDDNDVVDVDDISLLMLMISSYIIDDTDNDDNDDNDKKLNTYHESSKLSTVKCFDVPMILSNAHDDENFDISLITPFYTLQYTLYAIHYTSLCNALLLIVINH